MYTLTIDQGHLYPLIVIIVIIFAFLYSEHYTDTFFQNQIESVLLSIDVDDGLCVFSSIDRRILQVNVGRTLY